MRTAQPSDRRRGRPDTRPLCARTRLNGYLRAYCPFPRSAPLARLVRPVRTTEKTTTETVYLITTPASPPATRTLTACSRSFGGTGALRAATGCVT